VATGFFADKKPDLARDQMDDPRDIIEETLRAFDRGKRVLIPGKLSVRVTALAPRLFPRTMMAQLGERVVQSLNRASGSHH
jgi:short-subunit dehydrogenase